MDELPLQKIAISGPTLASLIQRISSSSGDVDGLLLGHVTNNPSSNLSDDDPSPSSPSSSASTALIATITSFISSSSTSTFYDFTGRVDALSLRRLLPSSSLLLIGWFSARRKTPLRPSLREFSVTSSLSTKSQFSFPVQNSLTSINFSPRLFLLFTTPFSDQIIHTHEYRAYQFRVSSNSFEPKSIDIVNIGPAFRGHYGSFCPNSPFPALACEMRGSPMAEDKDEGSLNYTSRVAKDQRELDMCAEGFEIGSLSRLMGSEAANYTAGLEDLYEKMLAKLESLARLVEKSSAKVLEQESHNMKLRYKAAGLD
ncbi:hypothetical protein L1049_008440 [Liquidambar formosana]|uniref:BRCA1-A complex subunit Abraxas n=1 Tax=Liquidambar formosana TaxID=63359 RepID=A0AAP0X8A3_LIQFO